MTSVGPNLIIVNYLVADILILVRVALMADVPMTLYLNETFVVSNASEQCSRRSLE
jgi:hypothetical protein